MKPAVWDTSVLKFSRGDGRNGNSPTEMMPEEKDAHLEVPEEEDAHSEIHSPSDVNPQVLRVGIKEPKSGEYSWGRVYSPQRKPSLPKFSNMEQLHEFSRQDFSWLENTAESPVLEILEAEARGERDGKASFEALIQPKLRNSQPVVKTYARGSQQQVAAAEEDEETFKRAWEEFQNDKFASSNEASVNSRKAWWIKRAERLGLEPFPLTPTLIDTAGTLLKIGSYRSAHLYLQTMKRVHAEKGHDWPEPLNLAMKDAIRSCARGKGPDKSCPALDMRQLANISELDPVSDGPRRPRDTVILFAHFACREVEAALRIRPQISIEPSEENCGVVSVFLPASKVDPKGFGVLRRLGCSCKTCPELCPVAAAARIIKDNESYGGAPSDPFLYTGKEGMAPTKATMITCFRVVAKALGWKDEDCKTITGHTLRCTGAQYFARVGVEYYKIQLFCRWGSDTILKYLRDIPLEGSEDWLNQAVEGRHQSLEEICFQASASVKSLDKKIKEQDVEKIVLKALESHSTDVLTQVTLKHEELVKALDSIKQQQLVMDDHWAADLSRRFLPKFVRNYGSGKVHAVRDDSCAGCGFAFRNSKDFTLVYSIPEKARRCEAAGCAKLFERYAPPEP